MADRIFYAEVNVTARGSSAATTANNPSETPARKNKKGHRNVSGGQKRRQKETVNVESQRSRRSPDSSSYKFKYLIIGLSLTSLILLASTITLAVITVASSNNEDLQLVLDKCSCERHSPNISWTRSEDSERNLTQLLHRSTQVSKCLKQAIQEAEWTSKCPAGWTLLNHRCYFFSTERRTRPESDEFCKAQMAQLATVKGQDNILQCYIRNLGAAYWVGLVHRTERHQTNIVMRWYWPDGAAEPSMASSPAGFCARIDGALGVADCSVQLQWICQKGTDKSKLFERMKSCYS
ncbi:oxidized low-density lipoprotein receptor 1 [Xenopus laevis]|uniref:Oxidized low-density lipoprotein receptor 1 n=2 Tax=Xenopus laevis TaxID=8355 RepID=A0A1L8I3U9_XENLA|nr:oxidized low-density lipoprotein receptor 1 [Xenopus laevis]OCU02798.1 hypothetical protein XELAEV_18008568mg [Xenopus laevis]